MQEKTFPHQCLIFNFFFACGLLKHIYCKKKVENRIFGVSATAERNKWSGKMRGIQIMFLTMIIRGHTHTQTCTHWHKSSEMMHETGTQMALRCWDLAFDDFCIPLHLRPWHTCMHAHTQTHTKQIKWISGTLVLSHWPPNPVLCYPAKPCAALPAGLGSPS